MISTKDNKKKSLGFGKRMAKVRKSQGLTQQQLADIVGTTRRVVAYYEKEADFPPAHLLPEISKALDTGIDELLGITNQKIKPKDTEEIKLLKNFRKTLELPKADQKVIHDFIKAFLKKNKTSS